MAGDTTLHVERNLYAKGSRYSPILLKRSNPDEQWYRIWIRNTGGATLSNCIVTRSKYGITLHDTQGDVSIRNCLISESEVGLLFSPRRGSNASITNSTITDNEIGIRVYYWWTHGENPSEPIIKHNNILRNTRYDVLVDDSQYLTIEMCHNWWGTVDDASTSAHIWDYHDDFTPGEVNYAPILTGPLNNTPSPPPNSPPSLRITSPVNYSMYMGNVSIDYEVFDAEQGTLNVTIAIDDAQICMGTTQVGERTWVLDTV